MDNEELLRLIERVSNDTASEEDLRIYNAWCNSFQEKGEAIPDFSEIQSRMLLNIDQQITNKPVRRIFPYYKVAVAAAVLAFLTIGAYFILHRNQPVQQMARSEYKNDIAPGGNKAVLTLGNGKTITLTGAKNGVLASEGNTAINKTADGRVAYNAGESAENAPAVTYNTITTPRAGTYQVTLPDGSQVWLNAASSIRFPTAFAGKDRKVEITGEAYFEVAHNEEKPFKVLTATQEVTVLGTHFNINAYADEPAVKTTLLQGSVEVTKSADHQIAMLKPGEQAILSGNIQVVQANLDQEVAWKNGDFIFNEEALPNIMRQVSRWYDVDIAYPPNMKNMKFNGMVSRSKNISAVLKMIELTGKVHFTVEGRRVAVMK